MAACAVKHPIIKIFRKLEMCGGTFGKIQFGDEELYTVERPWKKNETFVSCIPAGEYKLEPHHSTKHPNTFALVGDTVSHYEDPVKQRSTILFDVANFPSELLGCIAAGDAITTIHGVLGVTNSRDSVKRLLDYIKANGVTKLVII